MNEQQATNNEQQTTSNDPSSPKAPAAKQRTVLLAGGSGLIGSRLAALLRERHYDVRILTRSPRQPGEFRWDPINAAIDEAALEGIDAVVNLAGAGIADKRWTPRRKQLIVESRVQAARVLADAFARTGHKPQAYISASAIGYYGNSGEKLMREADAPAEASFLVDCCRQWEQAADLVAAQGIRTVKFRIGVVLALEGGALPEVLKPLRFGLGAYFGDGQAWWSWVHRDDVCNMVLWALETQAVEGVYNAVAPAPVRGKAMVQAIAKAMRQPAVFLPAPSFALRVFLGKMSAVVLNSNRVSAEKAEAEGFKFQYPELGQALAAVFGK